MKEGKSDLVDEGLSKVGKVIAGVTKDDTVRLERIHAHDKEVLEMLEKVEQVATDNEGIRNAFKIGQEVLVRDGRDWFPRKILGITVFRNVDGGSLGEPTFWFSDYGNIPLERIMAREDIDPKPQQRPVLPRSAGSISI